jgi:hypothetical protein
LCGFGFRERTSAGKTLGSGIACVVDQDVDGAQRGDRVGHAGVVGDVEWHGDGRTAAFGDLVDHRLRALHPEVVDQHLGPRATECER